MDGRMRRACSRRRPSIFFLKVIYFLRSSAIYHSRTVYICVAAFGESCVTLCLTCYSF